MPQLGSCPQPHLALTSQSVACHQDIPWLLCLSSPWHITLHLTRPWQPAATTTADCGWIRPASSGITFLHTRSSLLSDTNSAPWQQGIRPVLAKLPDPSLHAKQQQVHLGGGPNTASPTPSAPRLPLPLPLLCSQKQLACHTEQIFQPPDSSEPPEWRTPPEPLACEGRVSGLLCAHHHQQQQQQQQQQLWLGPPAAACCSSDSQRASQGVHVHHSPLVGACPPYAGGIDIHHL
jgi:hypothetical protein